MTVAVEGAAAVPGDVAARARPVFTGPVAPDGSEPADATLLAKQGCTGALGGTATFTAPDGALEVVVGMGKLGELDAEACRRAGAALAAATAHCDSVALDVSGVARGPLDPARVGCAVTEGVLLGAYRFTRLKSEPKVPDLRRVVLVDPDGVGLGLGRCHRGGGGVRA